DEMDAEFQRRVAVIHYLVENKINDHRQLWRLVSGYYKDPNEVLARIQVAGAPPVAPMVAASAGGT
ncbi:MAG TPA: hypothetical protein VN842_01695, partial [Thermoplasmata archaeon]|nr:hypothetical protein [Thermoplasmata archaeon]